ncbi:protein phosphatase 2C domain-containing protein [Schaalia cardiffensis]|uniref:protein phosphatase 2C domain-containing protein n=1 Tax=Schaalia cardiffensis TaxID=181487 RepID=UPI0023F40039|nr:protein phosphatase 2C domain-containing protein [Schaalia cardiffensis]
MPECLLYLVILAAVFVIFLVEIIFVQKHRFWSFEKGFRLGRENSRGQKKLNEKKPLISNYSASESEQQISITKDRSDYTGSMPDRNVPVHDEPLAKHASHQTTFTSLPFCVTSARAPLHGHGTELSVADSLVSDAQDRASNRTISVVDNFHKLSAASPKYFARSREVHADWNPAYSADRTEFEGGVIWAASRVGRRHLCANLPCQDAFATRSTDSIVSMIVADGVGSHRFSEFSSRRVVSTLTNIPFEEIFRGCWKATAREIISMARDDLIAEFRTVFDFDRVAGTTVVAAWARNHGDRVETRWLSIGDSAISVLALAKTPHAEGRFRVLNRGAKMRTEFTDSLPSSGSDFQWGVEDLVAGQLLLLASDGYFKQLEEQPEHTFRNISRVINGLGDPAQFLLALRHDGAGFDDDATAILFQVISS